MPAEVPVRLYRRLLPRLPVIVALVFGLYSLALVAYSVNSWRYMKQDADRFLVADSTRRAAVLGDRADEISTEAALHASLIEIRNYLINRDLGMSPRYGLDASLQAIEDAFNKHTPHKGGNIPSRIIYIGTDGKLLADTKPGEPVPRFEGVPSLDKRLRFNPQAGLLIAIEPVIHKEVAEGLVVTISPVGILYRNLITSTSDSQYREVLMTSDGQELPSGSGGQPIDAQLLRSLAQTPRDSVLPVAGLGGSSTTAAFADALLVNTSIPGLSLQLVTLLPAERAHGHLLSPGVLLAIGLVPILLLIGAIWLDRQRMTAARLQGEVQLAEQQRLWAEQRNVLLEQEISHRKTIEQALKESEERWHLALSGANDGIWDWDPQSGKVYFSERWKSMLGYRDDEIGPTVEEWISRIHPDDYAATMAEVQKNLRGETDFYSSEHRLRCKNGEYKWILDRGRALLDDKGQAIRMSGSHTDITGRRHAEEAIQDRNEQLNTIFDLSPDGFVSFDAARCVKYLSPAFTRITGLDGAQLIGLDEDSFSEHLKKICLPEACFAGIAPLRAMQQGSRHDGKDRRQKIELAGTGKHVIELGLRTAHAESVSQILYLRDITHETEVDRLKSEFLTTAAHELRTPMASIFGFTELLLTQEFDETDRKEFLSTIYRQSELMIVIINELLDLARIEARSGKDFTLARIDVRHLIHETVVGFKTPQDRSSPQEPPANGPLWVRADRQKLTEAVSNVLSNAYKYSPDGGAVTIELIETSGDNETQPRIGIRITDPGIGMTPEQLARVCERFYRADTSGKIPGTGLGMSIVKEIIEQHGGELQIASQVGAGSAVTLWLLGEPQNILT
jgi:PAS domain S-box-containing protein